MLLVSVVGVLDYVLVCGFVRIVGVIDVFVFMNEC